MYKGLYLTLLIFFMGSLVSCSSLDGDAEEAAHLSKESMNYARQNNLEDAGKVYEESQKIISKYKETDKFDEFYKAYLNYLEN